MLNQEQLQAEFEKLLDSESIEYLDDFVEVSDIRKHPSGEYISITTHLAFKLYEAGFIKGKEPEPAKTLDEVLAEEQLNK